MSSPYAFVFPCTKNYLHEARPLVKSLKTHHDDYPIYITTIAGEHAVTEQDFDDLGKVNIVQAPETDTEFRAIRTYRFKLANELGNKHAVILLLDADMVLLRPIEKFFRIAETGVMIGCSDSTILRYERRHFEEYDIETPFDNVIHPFFSTVPLFVDPSYPAVSEFLDLVWENPSGNDLEVPNRIVAATGRHEDMLLLNSYQWTNIHHSMLKPETFVKRTDGGLISYQGQWVYMLHGHLGTPHYTERDLIDPMVKNYTEKDAERARSCVELLKAEYAKYEC